MKAIVYPSPDIVELQDRPDPTPGAGQIRVRVHAAGLNRADILQRKGRYPAPPGWPSDIPGLEYAGEVESLGPGASRWKVGDRVMGLVGGGAQAERLVVHQDEALAIPPSLSYTEAAAIPEAFLTAWDALVVRGRLQRGERVLIHAVGSGVGTAALQLARQMGATVAGSSRTPEKLAQALELGLDEAIDASSGAGEQKGRAFAAGEQKGRSSAAGKQEDRSSTAGDHKGRPYDVIVDVLGGPAFAANLELLAPRGRLVMLGFLQGPKADLSLEPILRKRLEVIGTVMRTRLAEERVPMVRRFAEEVLPLFASGAVRPIVGASYPMAEIAAAHQAMERDENFGKLVIVM